jgi:hypothetical protein
MIEIKVCITCGLIFDPDDEGYYDYCSPCRRIKNAKRFKFYPRYSNKIPESRRKAGRKAYYSRLANLYFSDKERFERLFSKFKAKHPHRAGQITRKINQIKNDFVFR